MIQNISQYPGIVQVLYYGGIIAILGSLLGMLLQALHAGVRMLKAKATIMECEAQVWQKRTK